MTESRVDSLNGLLYRSDAASIAILAGLLLGWLLATALVWYLLCGRRHSFLPLSVGAGGVPVSYTHLDVYKRQARCW